MKAEEKKKAIQMRKKGVAMGEIAKELGVAKSSVSYWVRGIQLTAAQRNKLNANGHSVDAIEKRRLSRLANLTQKRNEIMERAMKEAAVLSSNSLWCVGVALYWGEGGKTQNATRIANSDPEVIALMMRFFRKVCEVEEGKFHGHIHTFAHCDEKKAERYWSSVSGISQSCFFKTYKKQSSASKKKRDTLPYGTFQIYVHDTNFFFRMMGWIEYLKQNEL
tara:strand:- start:5839 stop:6498 length:660 start_codon:yes stop_codon:yes gene_type:complete